MILTKYLIKEIFKSQIAILFILLLIFFCQQLVRVLGSAASGNIPADLVLSLLGLGMPTMAQLMLPLSLFIAVLLTLGRLYAESEVTVMRACGVGQRILVRVVVILSCATAALAAYNCLWLSPWAIQQQAQIIEEAKANPRIAALSAGQFMSSGNGDFVLFINDIQDNKIQDIYLFQMRERGKTKPSVVVAKTGEMQSLANGDQVLTLEHSQRIEGSALLPDFKITEFEQYQAYLGRQDATSQEQDTDLLDLHQLISDNSPQVRAELNWRLSLILAVPIMALLAVPMSKVNPRQGRFAKILPALLLYLIYFLLQSSLKSAGTAGKLEVGLLMPLVNVAFALLALVLNSWNTAFMYQLRQALANVMNRTKG